MLEVVLVLFVAIVLYSLLKGEIEYVRDTLEIQLRQARFRLDRLEGRVRELEAGAPAGVASEPAAQPVSDPGSLTSPAP
jgi:hypothetical protein